MTKRTMAQLPSTTVFSFFEKVACSIDEPNRVLLCSKYESRRTTKYQSLVRASGQPFVDNWYLSFHSSQPFNTRNTCFATRLEL